MSTSVTLATPIKRGEETITVLNLRKPDSGSLRGLCLTDVLRMDVDSMAELVPRLCQITEPEFRTLEPYDLMQVGKQLTGFLVNPPSESAVK